MDYLAVLGGSTCPLALAVPRVRRGHLRPAGLPRARRLGLYAFDADHFFLDKLDKVAASRGSQGGTAAGGRAMVPPWQIRRKSLEVLRMAISHHSH